MAAVNQVVTEYVGKPESRPLFPAGNLAARIAGNKGHYDLISASTRAAYRNEVYDPQISLQAEVINPQVKPVIVAEERLDGFAVIIAKNR